MNFQIYHLVVSSCLDLFRGPWLLDTVPILVIFLESLTHSSYKIGFPRMLAKNASSFEMHPHFCKQSLI